MAILSEDDKGLLARFLECMFEQCDAGDRSTALLRIQHAVEAIDRQDRCAIDFMKDILEADFQTALEHDAA